LAVLGDERAGAAVVLSQRAEISRWDSADYEVYRSGLRSLWDEVEAACRWRDDRGCPGFDRFGLIMTPDSHTLWLDDQANPVPTRG
jgi:hypothetical protein